MEQTRSLIAMVKDSRSAVYDDLKFHLKRYVGRKLDRIRVKLDIPRQSDVSELSDRLQSIDAKLSEIEERRKNKALKKKKAKDKVTEAAPKSKKKTKKKEKKKKSSQKTNAALT